MKKKYLEPEVEILALSFKAGILQGSNGEDIGVVPLPDDIWNAASFDLL